jgi:transcription termination/antitermination protein NusG
MTETTDTDAEDAPVTSEDVAVSSGEPDLVLDATNDQDSSPEVEGGGWGGDDEEIIPVESPYDRPGRWYVVHTYSGYENKVRSNMGNVVASRGIEDRVFEVVIPMEDVVEFKGGKKVTVQKKVFPGYLLVRCDLDDDTWGAIRNTPGVTGFVGPGTKPTPL